MQQQKFLTEKYIPLLQKTPTDTLPLFGKMNFLQMIDHIIYSFQQAQGLKDNQALFDEAATQKMYAFMMSDKPFKDNTPNSQLPDTPPPSQFQNSQQAIDALQNEIKNFIETFQREPDKRIMNPFFGNLNFQEWCQLLYKHTTHHLRQFGITSHEI